MLKRFGRNDGFPRFRFDGGSSRGWRSLNTPQQTGKPDAPPGQALLLPVRSQWPPTSRKAFAKQPRITIWPLLPWAKPGSAPGYPAYNALAGTRLTAGRWTANAGRDGGPRQCPPGKGSDDAREVARITGKIPRSSESIGEIAGPPRRGSTPAANPRRVLTGWEERLPANVPDSAAQLADLLMQRRHQGGIPGPTPANHRLFWSAEPQVQYRRSIWQDEAKHV